MSLGILEATVLGGCHHAQESSGLEGGLPLSWGLGLGGGPGSDLVSKALFVAEGGSEGTVSCQAKGDAFQGKMLMCFERGSWSAWLVVSLARAKSLSTGWRVSLETRFPCNHSPEEDNNNLQNVTAHQVKIPDPLGT